MRGLRAGAQAGFFAQAAVGNSDWEDGTGIGQARGAHARDARSCSRPLLCEVKKEEGRGDDGPCGVGAHGGGGIEEDGEGNRSHPLLLKVEEEGEKPEGRGGQPNGPSPGPVAMNSVGGADEIG